MHKTVLKTLARFPVRFAVALVALVTGVCFLPSRGHNPGATIPDATALAQDDCNPGNNGTPHPCSEINCGDYMCPCDPSPSDCYYAWGSGCYNF